MKRDNELNLHLLDTKAVAKILNISTKTLIKWRRDANGVGPDWYRFGRKVFYRESDVKKFIYASAVCSKASKDFFE